jgi:DNA helicase-2/ATP-dependent DNA helicase PcrA
MDLSGLNPAQREAVTAPPGPLIVLAGAGSGKTRTLTYRLAYALHAGWAAPHQLLAITFTNRAAKEMRQRVEALVGGTAQGMWVATFHAACLRLLRVEAARLGYPKEFSVYDREDQEKVLRQVTSSAQSGQVASFASAISRLKGELVTPEEFSRSAEDEPWRRPLAEVYDRYQRTLASAGAMDFDDLIGQTIRLFRTAPEVLERYRDRFRFLLVDEYQDTNIAQYSLVRLLASRDRRLTVVGDPDQAIYGWRGADFRNVFRLREDFPDARVVVLHENYRSTAAILEAANAVVSVNRQREPKRLTSVRGPGELLAYGEAEDELAEADLVAAELVRQREAGADLGDIAVLYRLNAQSRPLEERLLAWRVPYRIYGAVRFYERQEVKDALAYLRAAVSPADRVALSRAMARPKRGLGQGALDRIDELAAEADVAPARALEDETLTARLTGRARQGAKELGRVLREIRRAAEAGLGPTACLAIALEEGGLRRAYDDGTAEGESRLQNLEELQAKAAEAEAQGVVDVAEFLGQVALFGDREEGAGAERGVTLMTLHMAKGLEFATVFLTGLEERLFPLSRQGGEPEDLEEERRLMYVGMTRAKDRLYLSRARMRRRHGQAVPTLRSRFLTEIPAGLMREFGRPDRPPVRPAARQMPRLEALRDGDRVRHDRFGWGTVVAVSPTDGDVEVAIAFDEGGIRHLLLSLAPLARDGGAAPAALEVVE